MSSMLSWKSMCAWDLALLNASGPNKAGPMTCEWAVLINRGWTKSFLLVFLTQRYFLSDVLTNAVHGFYHLRVLHWAFSIVYSPIPCSSTFPSISQGLSCAQPPQGAVGLQEEPSTSSRLWALLITYLDLRCDHEAPAAELLSPPFLASS